MRQQATILILMIGNKNTEKKTTYTHKKNVSTNEMDL